MNNEPSTVLETAWQQYAQLKTNAAIASKQYFSLRLSVMGLAVLTIVSAIIVCSNNLLYADSLLTEFFQGALIITPIATLVIWSFTIRLRQGQYWQVLNTSAAAIINAIYLYRTLLIEQQDRHLWLQDRITTIYEEVVEQIGGNLVLKPYQGSLPPRESPEIQQGDDGWNDLLITDYVHYRLETQLNWHEQTLKTLDFSRRNLRLGIVLFLGLSPILPILGGQLMLGIALTTTLGLMLMGLLEINRFDDYIHQYNQLIWKLKTLRNTWQALDLKNCSLENIVHLILSTETLLISQAHSPNNNTISFEAKSPSDLLTKVVQTLPLTLVNLYALPQASEPKNTAITVAEIGDSVGEEIIKKEQTLEKTKTETSHAFVVMPFGKKQGPDGRWIDFDSIYFTLIKPAIEAAGFESFRADEETITGDILTDMLQELLLADIVLADLSIDNANVFYELGIRHALRKRGVVHIQCGRAYLPYDIFNVRTLAYHCNQNGQPDPAYIEKDKQAIINLIRSTWESESHRIHSPLFNLLTGLPEPNRKLLQTPLATSYWQEYTEWQKRVAIAQKKKQIGDVLLLTEEVKNPFIKCEVIAESGEALKELQNYALALKQYRQGLKLDPKNSLFRLEEAFHLSRLKQYDEAIVKLEWLLQDEPHNIEALSYLGRTYKEVWRDEWEDIIDEKERLKQAYESAYLLERSVETYLQAYQLDQNHYYSGINAVTLLSVLEHLAQEYSQKDEPDYKVLRDQLSSLFGAVQFCLESKAQQDPADFWVFISLGDLSVSNASTPKQVKKAYKKALTLLWKDKFVLQSTLNQLSLLQSLKFRLEYVQVGIDVLKAEYERIEKQERTLVLETDLDPVQVFLFSGHMIDHPDRPKPRFPAAMEAEARSKIEAVLDQSNANDNDLGITAGIACGGDILFLEACLQRNMKIETYLPFSVEEFIQQSVNFAGDGWVERFYKIQNHPKLTLHFQPDRLGPVPKGDNPFSRNNRWAFYSTLMYGIDKVRLIVLWDGRGGDGPGGTNDMVNQVRQFGGIVEHLDTTKFDYWDKVRNS